MSDLLPLFADSGAYPTDGASAAIRRYCGWHVWPVLNEDLVVDGNGSRVLLLPTGRLVDVTACTQVHRGAPAPYTPETVDVAGLEWSEKGFLYTDSVWTRRARGVTVTVVHGYDTVPDLAELCTSLAARVHGSPAGLQQQQAGQRMEIYLRGMLDADKDLLAPYRVTVHG